MTLLACMLVVHGSATAALRSSAQLSCVVLRTSRSVCRSAGLLQQGTQLEHSAGAHGQAGSSLPAAAQAPELHVQLSKRHCSCAGRPPATTCLPTRAGTTVGAQRLNVSPTPSWPFCRAQSSRGHGCQQATSLMLARMLPWPLLRMPGTSSQLQPFKGHARSWAQCPAQARHNKWCALSQAMPWHLSVTQGGSSLP